MLNDSPQNKRNIANRYSRAETEKTALVIILSTLSDPSNYVRREEEEFQGRTFWSCCSPGVHEPLAWRMDLTALYILHFHSLSLVLVLDESSLTDQLRFTWTSSQPCIHLCIWISFPLQRSLRNNLFCLPCLRWQCALCSLSSLLFPQQ